MSVDIRASEDGTKAIIGINGGEQFTVSSTGNVEINGDLTTTGNVEINGDLTRTQIGFSNLKVISKYNAVEGAAGGGGDGVLWIGNANADGTFPQVGGFDSQVWKIHADRSATSAHELEFRYENVSQFTLTPTGEPYFPGMNTAGSGSAVYRGTGGQLLYNSSSLRYKIDIEDVDLNYSKVIVLSSEPIWYRRNTETTKSSDDSNWSYWGFGAEQIAKLDPRMVVWGHPSEHYEKDEEGQPKLKEGVETIPESVCYDRYTVHLVKVAQEQHKEIEGLKLTIQQLEVRLQALEAK